MAKIFSPPKSLKEPNLSFENIPQYKSECEKYMQDLKEILLKNAHVKQKPTTNIGEVIQFPVADGYAQYMVASMKPLELVHIPLSDAWHFQYANRLTAKDVQEEIDQQKAINKLFSKKG
jgi:hypothetical protein